MIIEYLPLLMFAVLLVLLALGVPIAFSLFTTALGFAYFAWGASGGSILVSAVWGVMNNFVLIAIPLFIFMSLLLEKSTIIADLFDSMYKWSGGLRGGLAVATVVVGAVIGAISGVVAAGVIGLALIALPQMLRYGYNQRISLGAVMAGGTLGQVIPPSLNMVVYGAITGVSVASLFAGGANAGLMLLAVFSGYILIRAFINKDLAPALAKEDRASWSEKWKSTRSVLLPILLIIIVIGSILTGTATPTEGAAIGVVGTVLISLGARKLPWQGFVDSLWGTGRMTGMVGLILAGAASFSAVFSGIGGNRFVSNLVESLPGGQWGVLIFSVLFVFLLGMFLETLALIMLAAPILTPLIANAGFDPLWWGIIFMVVLQTGFLTPPFGFAIFYLKSAVGRKVAIADIYKATPAFIGLQVLVIVLLIVVPGLATWLPDLLL
jgi:tripartite ATP-independent transporter DctM subunit